MTDKKLQQLMSTVRTEIHRRIGKKMCSELDADCYDCRARFMVGIMNSWINVLEPFKPKKK